MKLNPKKSGLAKMLDVNHIVPRAKTDLMSQSEIDEDEDKFEDLDTEIGETDLKVEGLIRREDPVVRSEYSLRPRKSKV